MAACNRSQTARSRRPTFQLQGSVPLPNAITNYKKTRPKVLASAYARAQSAASPCTQPAVPQSLSPFATPSRCPLLCPTPAADAWANLSLPMPSEGLRARSSVCPLSCLSRGSGDCPLSGEHDPHWDIRRRGEFKDGMEGLAFRRSGGIVPFCATAAPS